MVWILLECIVLLQEYNTARQGIGASAKRYSEGILPGYIFASGGK
jgi:hypothetical protein